MTNIAPKAAIEANAPLYRDLSGNGNDGIAKNGPIAKAEEALSYPPAVALYGNSGVIAAIKRRFRMLPVLECQVFPMK